MFYKVVNEKDYEIACPCDNRFYENLRNLFGPGTSIGWTDFEVTLEKADSKSTCLHSDFPWYMSSALILTEKAINFMGDVFLRNGELLPIHTNKNVPLFVFNCNIVDALDEKKSEIMKLNSTGKILFLKKISLREHLLKDTDIFRLNTQASPTIVSDNFIRLYKESGLKGLAFQRLDEIKMK